MKKLALSLLLVMVLAVSANAATFYGDPSLLHGNWSGSISVLRQYGTTATEYTFDVVLGPDHASHDLHDFSDSYMWIASTIPGYPGHTTMQNLNLTTTIYSYVGDYYTETTFYDGTTNPTDNPFATSTNLIRYEELSGGLTSEGWLQGMWTTLAWIKVGDDLNTIEFSGVYKENITGGYTEFTFEGTLERATPIPGAVWLLGSGLAGLIGLRRRMEKEHNT